jgi:hypothetical protein
MVIGHFALSGDAVLFPTPNRYGILRSQPWANRMVTNAPRRLVSSTQDVSTPTEFEYVLPWPCQLITRSLWHALQRSQRRSGATLVVSSPNCGVLRGGIVGDFRMRPPGKAIGAGALQEVRTAVFAVLFCVLGGTHWRAICLLQGSVRS